MTTTDRDDLYQPLYRDAIAVYRKRLEDDYTARAAIRAVVDLVLDAHPEQTDLEVLRAAVRIMDRTGFLGDSERRGVATLLEAEIRGIEAAQEKAAADVEREKLIEQAARMLMGLDQIIPWEDSKEEQKRRYLTKASHLVDAGWRPAPTTDGGEA